MSSKPKKAEGGKRRINVDRPSNQSKSVCNVSSRKFIYRVGYTWNRGGRLKELRIRTWARKFLHIWIRNTFGRVLPHEAKRHYDRVVLRRAFNGWTEEWWTSRREWILKIRAEYHHNFNLSTQVFQSWCAFVSLQKEKKIKLKHANLHADRQRVGAAWSRWELFIRKKKNMMELALEQNRRSTLRTAWKLWQARLQKLQDLSTLEAQYLKQRDVTLKKKALLQWKEMWIALGHQKQQESDASHHFTHRVKRKALYVWMFYVYCCQTKRKSQAAARRHYNLRLTKMYWNTWSKALHCKWREEACLTAAAQLTVRSTQRRTLLRWWAYVSLCREEAKKNQMATQHYHCHLLSVGLQGFDLNAICNKRQRMNNNIAVQHSLYTMMKRFWKLWQEHLEEAEDRRFEPLRETAQKKYRVTLLRGSFHHWREIFAEQRHMQELEHKADVWRVKHLKVRFFDSWVEFTLQRRLHGQRKQDADAFNKQRRRKWVLYTWRERAEKHKERLLLERVAILHEEASYKRKVFSYWRQKAKEKIMEKKKLIASDQLYMRTLLYRTMTEWKNNSTEIRQRRNRERQACQQGDFCCMRWALERWKKFFQSQREKKNKQEQMLCYHETELLKRTFAAWKTHHLHLSHIRGLAEKLYRLKMKTYLRGVLSTWRVNASLRANCRLLDRRAQKKMQSKLQHRQREVEQTHEALWHWALTLQYKVLYAWRLWAAEQRWKREQTAVCNRLDRDQPLRKGVSCILKNTAHMNDLTVNLTQHSQEQNQREKISKQEQMLRYHETKLLKRTFAAWKTHHLHLSHIRGLAEKLYRLKMKTYLRCSVNMERERIAAGKLSPSGSTSTEELSEVQALLLQTLRQWKKRTKEVLCVKRAIQHYESKLLCKALQQWEKYHTRCRKYKLQHRQRDVEQTHEAVWHWALTLQYKVLYSWRVWAAEQRWKRQQASVSARVYRDQLLRKGVSCILTYAAHMNDLTVTLAQHSQEQRSRHLLSVVRRCALHWKQRALSKRQGEMVQEQLIEKNVTFSLTTTAAEGISSSDAVGQEDEYVTMLKEMLRGRERRRKPYRLEDPIESPVTVSESKRSSRPGVSLPGTPEPYCSPLPPCRLTAGVLVTTTSCSSITYTFSEARVSLMDSSVRNQTTDVLLPPSAFMNTVAQNAFEKNINPCPGEVSHELKQNLEYPEHRSGVPGEGSEGATSALSSELLSIQLEMQSYQQDRKQLRAWRKLKEVLQEWLQLSAVEAPAEISSVCQEVKELEERIHHLSTSLAKRKPTMLLYAERTQKLQTK